MRVWNWPVLPVMPCVMTLLFLFTRMDMVSSPRSSLAAVGGSHDLLGRLRHVVGRDDRQARLGEDLAAELFIRALHAHHERHLEAYGLRRGDHAFGDGVALHDAAEDVHEYRLQSRV